MTEDAKSVVIQNLGDVTTINKLHISIRVIPRGEYNVPVSGDERQTRRIYEEFRRAGPGIGTGM